MARQWLCFFTLKVGLLGAGSPAAPATVGARLDLLSLTVVRSPEICGTLILSPAQGPCFGDGGVMNVEGR